MYISRGTLCSTFDHLNARRKPKLIDFQNSQWPIQSICIRLNNNRSNVGHGVIQYIHAEMVETITREYQYHCIEITFQKSYIYSKERNGAKCENRTRMVTEYYTAIRRNPANVRNENFVVSVYLACRRPVFESDEFPCLKTPHIVVRLLYSTCRTDVPEYTVCRVVYILCIYPLRVRPNRRPAIYMRTARQKQFVWFGIFFPCL